MKKCKTLAWRFLSALVILAMLMPATLFVSPMLVAQAADTGWYSPSANASVVGDGDGDGFEDSPDNAYADDCNWASNIDGADDSHLYYNFGIDSAIPMGAVMSGIVVGLDGRVDSIQNTPYYEVRLSWDGGTSWSSPRSTPTLLGGGTVCLPPSDPEVEVGGQSDLWGHTPWSTSELSNANFRVQITSRATGTGSENRDFYLDRVSVRIIYASAHITGTVWSDDDADGVRDGGEAGLERHVTIYQDDGDSIFEGGSDDLEVGSDDGVDGTYDTGPFLDEYSYWIDVDAPAYYTLTTPSEEPYLVSLPDTNSVTVDFGYAPPNPGIMIAKTPDDQMVASGSTANFTIVVTNTGDVELTGVTVSDALVPDCNASLGTLPVGGHTSYGCTLANVTDGFINSAIATGTPPAGPDVTDADAAKVRLDDTLTCPANMIAYWNLDEVSGSDYDDFYDGHDGECAGNCPTPATGYVNGGQVFNGSDTGIDVPTVPGDTSFDWGVNDSFSIEFWMRTDSASTCAGNEVVVGRDDSPNSDLHWWVGCITGGEARFRLEDTTGNGAAVEGTTDLTDGDWHHVVAVQDASANMLRIYVDGTEEGWTPVTYASGFGSATAALNVGWLNLDPYYHFEGVLDEVALYGRALSLDEVRQHHNEGLAGRWLCEAGSYPPIIVSTPITNATVGRLFAYDVEAVGNPVPTYTLLITPTGMTIDSNTGLISWIPMFAQEGSHDVRVQATNSEGTDTQDFTIFVRKGTLCPADMIAYWELNETSGTSYYDFYDGHDGGCPVTEDCPAPATGHIGGAQEFSSTTGIDVPADAAFDWSSTDNFSIEFWMQTDSVSTCAGNEVVVGRDDSATDLHWWVGCITGGEARFRLEDTAGNGAAITGTTDLTDGDWHHVVAVRDADVNRLRIYVDGTEEDSTSVSYTSDFDSSTAALNIGWLNLDPYYHFNGIIDEVALYDRPLSTSEIQQHYNDGEPGSGYCINPDIAINKVANPPVAYLSDPVVYTYTVTNPGDDPLSSISLSDDRCTPFTVIGGDEDYDNELDPSESWVYTCEMTPSGDITNIANVTGTYSLGGIVTATDTAFVDVITPGIAIDKVADPTIIYPGEIVTYTYTVTNPGNDPLDVDLSDDKCSPLSSLGGDDNINGELDPGEIWTYECTAIVSADITNTVTVTGTDSSGGTLIVTDTAFVDVINPGIEIAKTPISQMARYHSTVTFTIAVTNTSDTALTSVYVSDVLVPDCDADLGSLDPMEGTSYTCTEGNVAVDFTNTAIVTGTPPIGPDVSNTDIAIVDVISPAIEIAKTPETQMVLSGSAATFTIAITNTGDVVLTDVSISDVLAPDCSRESGDLPDLLPSGNTSYVCTRGNVTGDFTNSATATGTPPVGPDVSDTDTASVDVINPAIEIVKTTDAQVVVSGSTVTFSIAVTNTGEVLLTDVAVSDVLVPDCNASLGSLVPLEGTSYTCVITDVTSSFLNSATAIGTPPVGPVVSDSDTAFVDVINEYIQIVKAPYSQTVLYNATATFTITITNISDTILTDVVVSDAPVPDCDQTVGTLAVGANYAYTCTVANVMSDFTNIAIVTGTPSVGPVVSDSDIAFVYVERMYQVYLPLVLRE